MKKQSPRTFWNYFKEKKNKCSGENISENFYDYFKTLTSEYEIEEDEECMDFSTFDELDTPFTINEIRKAIKLLGSNKSCSFDCIIYQYFKEGIDIICLINH